MISSLQNEKIKECVKLKQKKYRDLKNQFLIEGTHLLEEADRQDLIIEIFSSNLNFEFKNKKITYVSEHVLEKMSQTISPQKVITLCRKKQNFSLGERVIILDNVQDAGNVGTIMRNALAFGFDTIISSGVDFYNEKVIRSSQGAIFHLNVMNVKNLFNFLEEKQNNYYFYGTLLDDKADELSSIKFDKNQKDIMVIFGNEGQGISEEIQQILNQKIYIDINFESLNVASASAIVLHAFKKGYGW